MQPPTEDCQVSASGVGLWGALRELMEPVAGVDLTAPTGELWEAELDGPDETVGQRSELGR